MATNYDDFANDDEFINDKTISSYYSWWLHLASFRETEIPFAKKNERQLPFSCPAYSF